MGEDRPTYFSSWSQSLCFVLSRARDEARRHPDCKTYISVLDTNKLTEDAVILHTSDMKSVIHGAFSRYAHECLAYGKIHSPAYATVSLADIEIAGLAYFNDSLLGAGYEQQSGDLQTGLSAAQKIADLFPDDVQVVVQAYLLAVKAEEHHDEILNALKNLDIPASWLGDAKLTSEINMHGSVDAARALAIIKDLIASKKPDTVSKTTIQSRRSMEKLEQERRDNTPVGAVWKQFSELGS
ncbi:hypothetical protein HII31_09170 [Pseudocercospora fuligena]|uniref:Uncharacterized protein n=1 Tax=Pseudocercospora fuligena TaxID=685502 RepID=A0A8H6VJY7_9PEZI|nr:hypothetical protein HII31_09170 [Pseudocercospora fuligena]